MAVEEIVATFMRCQPPHKGHLKIVNKIKESGSTFLIGLSTSCDSKNPLPLKLKKSYVAESFNLLYGNIFESYDMWSFLTFIRQRTNNVHLIIGSDREAGAEDIMNRWQRQMQPFPFNSFKISVVARYRERDISGTLIRSYVKQRNYYDFSELVCDSIDKEKLYMDLCSVIT